MTDFYSDLTITGPTPYEGSYTDVTVLGTNTTVSDTNGTNDVYVDGGLNFNETKANENINITQGGSANDTISYSFNIDVTAGTTSSFLDWSHPQLTLTDSTTSDGDGLAGTSQANAAAWYSQYAAWLASLGPDAHIDTSTSLEVFASQSAKKGTTITDLTLTGITATIGGSTTVTSNDAGSHDTVLSFALDSDHIDLGANVTESIFDNYFVISPTTHSDDHGNPIADTTISLAGGSWSVDLYGIDVQALATLAGTDAHTYAWNHILLHV
jgi:hypothetical protein